MQLASHGAAGLQTARQALYRSINHNPATRNIHIPVRNNTRLSAGRRFVSQSRHFLAKFVGHLTAPGFGAQASTSYHSAARTTIQSRLSLPVRNALGKQAPTFFPRPPAVPRSVHQVGLGTARNFSSARPIFQNLVQNVPVAGRAVCEVDLDLKSSKKAALQKSTGKKTGKGKQNRTSFKVKEVKIPASLQQKDAEAVEFEHYFPAPSADVTACLHIPLAPTPTSRTPLSATSADNGSSLLPLFTLGSIHANHEMHSTRVSSLFSRLDAANVWDKGVQCSAYSHLEHGQGVCTILKVEFAGWTAAEVRSVIGESGTGWCTLEEVKNGPVAGNGYDSDCSDTSSILSGLTSDHSNPVSRSETPPPPIDPSASVVLPTLDFSSSFVNAVQSAPPTPPVLSRSSSSSSLNIGLSDFDYLSDSPDGVVVERPQMQFSADFVRRSEMESLF